MEEELYTAAFVGVALSGEPFILCSKQGTKKECQSWLETTSEQLEQTNREYVPVFIKRPKSL